MSHKCPPEFAWATDHGKACCKYYYTATDPDAELTFEDPVVECPFGAFKNCSDIDEKARCTTDKPISEIDMIYLVSPSVQKITDLVQPWSTARKTSRSQ